jgi:hypothetical protein
MAQDRLERQQKAEQRKPVTAPAAEEIVNKMPDGFFILRQPGLPDQQMFSSASLGCIGPVKSSFWCGGLLFQRERDQRGELLPLKIFSRPRPVFQEYGNFVHGDKRIIDSDQCGGFDGNFECKLMR